MASNANVLVGDSTHLGLEHLIVLWDVSHVCRYSMEYLESGFVQEKWRTAWRS